MSIFSPFVNWTKNTTSKLLSTSFQFFPLGNNYDYNRISEPDIINGGFLANDVVYSVISKTALLAAGLPYYLTKNGVTVENENDELLKFLQNPNKNQTYQQYIQELFINLNLLGDCYSYKEVEAIGFKDISLKPLPPYRLTATLENPNTILSEVSKYQFNDIQRTLDIMPEDIVHCMLVDPTMYGKQNVNGLSPLQAGNLAARALNNANIADAVIFENGAPQTLIVKKANGLSLTQSDIDKLDKATKQRMGGAHKSGNITSVTGDAQAIKIGSTPKELGTNESRVQQLRSLCNLWGVSSGEFNDPSNKTYNNAKESRKALYIDVCIPRLEQIMAEHEKKIFPIFGDGYKFHVDLDKIEVLNPDRNEQRKQLFEEFKAGLWTPEEFKKMI